jgi:hypothetical protein
MTVILKMLQSVTYLWSSWAIGGPMYDWAQSWFESITSASSKDWYTLWTVERRATSVLAEMKAKVVLDLKS